MLCVLYHQIKYILHYCNNTYVRMWLGMRKPSLHVYVQNTPVHISACTYLPSYIHLYYTRSVSFARFSMFSAYVVKIASKYVVDLRTHKLLSYIHTFKFQKIGQILCTYTWAQFSHTGSHIMRSKFAKQMTFM